MTDSNQHSEPDWTPAERVRMGIDSDSGEYGLQEDAHAALNGLLEQLEAAQKVIDAATEYVFSSDGNAFGKFHDTLAEYATSNPASEPEAS